MSIAAVMPAGHVARAEGVATGAAVLLFFDVRGMVNSLQVQRKRPMAAYFS